MNKEYLDKIHNIDENYNKIFSKIEGKNKIKNKLFNIAAIFIIVILVGTMSTNIYAKRKWDIQFKEYQDRDYGFANVAVSNGYIESIDMNYVYQNNIGVKVNSLIITDDHFESDIEFLFPKNMEISSDNFNYGYAIYDDSKNMYAFSERLFMDGTKTKFDVNYLKCLYKELGIKYDKNDIFGIGLSGISKMGTKIVKSQDKEIISKINLESIKGFPKSKKIYIRVFDVGYTMIDRDKDGKINDIEEFNISKDGEWIFELEVPEQMYNRQSISLNLESDIPNFELIKATATETKLVIQCKMNKIDEFIMNGKDMDSSIFDDILSHKLYITDNDGNEYYFYNFGTLKGKDCFYLDFNLNKITLEGKDLFLHVKIDDDEFVRKLYTN